MATTLANIRDYARNIMGESSNSGVYTDTFLNQIANQEQDRIFREFRWTFAQTNHLVSAEQDTQLEADIATTDTDITITASSGYPTSGSIYINGDVISYTGLTEGTSEDTLTGVTGISIASSENATVKYLYPLPSDFGNYANILVNNYRVEYVNIQEFKKEYYYSVDSGDEPRFSYPNGVYTTIASGGSNFILFSDDYANSEKIEIQYYPIPTDMDDSTDCSLPDEFALKVLGPLVASKAALFRGDPDGLASGHLQMGNYELQKMKEAYTKEHESFNNKLKTSALKRFTKI